MKPIKLTHERRDAPQQLDAILAKIRSMANDLVGWEWEYHMEEVGPNHENVYCSILFRPAVWPKISHPAAEYAAAQKLSRGAVGESGGASAVE